MSLKVNIAQDCKHAAVRSDSAPPMLASHAGETGTTVEHDSATHRYARQQQNDCLCAGLEVADALVLVGRGRLQALQRSKLASDATNCCSREQIITSEID